MIKVCDAIMGTGKSSAAIRYMNENSDRKFIYITPYLDEATRIKEGCPNLRFIEPSDKIPEYNFRKSDHTAALIKEGRNITTTHQAFKRYSDETLEDIRRWGYTLIIDENLELLERYDIHSDDIQMALDADYIEENDGVYSIKNTEYNGRMFKELFNFLRSRELVQLGEGDSVSLYYWVLPHELITSFDDVFILTYLFAGQSIRYFLDMYNIEYNFIGINRTEDGGYCFGDFPGYTPEYTADIKNMLHVLDSPKMNSVGDDRYALSKHWFERDDNEEDIEQLKKNVYNFFNNMHDDIPANQRMWGTYQSAEPLIKGKGYTNSCITFNLKSTNKYRDRKCLAYLTNIHMNVNEKKFYYKHGLEVDEDMFALSIMIQWVWRSAIRDGGEVYLYIPSRRMRELLIDWIESLSTGGDGTNAKTM